MPLDRVTGMLDIPAARATSLRWRARRGTRTAARPAFSLAELMIALVILGLGLLFIAAALPVGVDYTRRTLDLAAAEAAGDEAMQAIQLGVRTSQRAVNAALNTNPARLDSLVRPRTNDAAKLFPFDTSVEPVLKVRPLICSNVDMTPGTRRLYEAVDRTEEDIIAGPFVQRILQRYSIPATQLGPWQLDRPTGNNTFSIAATGGALSAATRVYPAISPDTPFSVDDFLSSEPNKYIARRMTSRDPTTSTYGTSEATKLSNARLVWTALYRRVAYDIDADGAGTAIPKRVGDPALYEFIVFVVRRPTPQHRFARQNPQPVNGDVFSRPAALAGSSAQFGTADRLMPEPWLVAFDQPFPPVAVPTVPPNAPPAADRQLPPTFNHLSELAFRCSDEVGKLLPVGSYIVPAMNDDFSGHIGNATLPQPAARRVGFVPHAPDTLPIYEVVKRPDSRTVVVKGNGFYPWVGGGAGPGDWLCWVIPPPFSERVGNEPMYDQRSQILTVVRRTMRVPEMP